MGLHRFGFRVGCSFIFALGALSCGAPGPGNAPQENGIGAAREQLSNAKLAGPREGKYVVSLGDCTGTLLSPYAILTAAHCVPEADTGQFTVSKGSDAANCLPESSSTGACSPISLRISRHEDVDLALLTSRIPLVHNQNTDFPKIGIGGSIPKIDSWGYGEGSYTADGGLVGTEHGTRLLRASFAVSQSLIGEIQARAAGGTAVCDGDSGGPATTETNGTTILDGVLRISEASPENPRCTKPDGRQSWVRPGAYMPFFEEVIGPCERTTAGGRTVASCRGAFRGQERRASGDGAFDHYTRLPGFLGVDTRDHRRGGAHSASSGHARVSIMSPSGHKDVDLERQAIVDEFGTTFPQSSDGKPTAPSSDPVIWKDRGWSQGWDERFSITGTQAPEVGRLIASFTVQTTPNRAVQSGACSATLIGPRLIRTAAHCVTHPNVTNTAMVWADSVGFELYRDGNSVRMTVNPYFYEIGGFYNQDRCWDATGNTQRGNLNACVLEDWALIVLPAGVWNSLGYIPAYMGYQGLTSGDLFRRGTSAGYPACLQANSPASCPGTVAINNFWKYADTNFDCEVSQFTSGTTVFRSGCDIGEGNSGGPFYDPGPRYLLGHAVWQNCTTCGYFNGAGTIGVDALTTDDFYMPNYYMGHNDWLFAEQNRLRSAYP